MTDILTTIGEDAMVLLKAGANQFCGKQYDEEGLSARAKIKYWVPNVSFATDINKLHTIISKLNKTSSYCIVRGQIINKEQPRGEKIIRKCKGKDATLEESERRWLAVDHDGFPTTTETLEEQLAELIAQYPVDFQLSSYVYQVTSSYGLKEGLYVRLYWLLDEPTTNGYLREYFKQFPELKVDISLYTPVQPHYVTCPLFPKDTIPPIDMEDRVGLVPNIIERVALGPSLMFVEPKEIDYQELVHIGDGNVAQIEHTIERLLEQTTSGSRHHSMMGCMTELIAIGTPAARVVQFGYDYLMAHGREPNADNEVEDAYESCLEKVHAGEARVNIFRLDDVFPDYEGDDILEQGEDDEMSDVVGYAPKLKLSYTNGMTFLARNYPENTFLRWNQDNWQWRRGCWHRMEVEHLNSEIMQETKFAPNIINSIEKAVIGQTYAKDLMPNRYRDRPTEIVQPMLVFRNGMCSLDDLIQNPHLSLMEHDPNYFNLNALGFSYDPKQECPVWDQFLIDCFGNDLGQIREFQKMFGYLLSGDKSHHKFFIFQGEPRSGKGTTFDVLSGLMGDNNCASLPITDLQGDFALQPLIGKSLWLIDEVNEQNSRMLEGRITDLIKTQTGGGKLQVNRKNKEILTDMHLEGRLVLACNRLPGFMDPSGAISARMVLFRFVNSFVGKEDFKLGLRLKAEFPGIFNWALRGVMHMMEDGKFVRPTTVSNFVEEHREAMSPVRSFMNECLTFSESEEVFSSDLYRSYQIWAAESGRKPMSAQRLRMELQQTDSRFHSASGRKRRESKDHAERYHEGVGLTPFIMGQMGLDVTIFDDD